MRSTHIALTVMIALLAVCGACVRGPRSEVTPPVKIKVENLVVFGTDEMAGEKPKPMLTFGFAIVNQGDVPVPDLRGDHVDEHARWFINGKEEPLSPPGGLDWAHFPDGVPPGERDAFGWELILENGTKSGYGETFTVQWEYLGVRSTVVRVDMKARSVRVVPQVEQG